jgi:hypothetical protein
VSGGECRLGAVSCPRSGAAEAGLWEGERTTFLWAGVDATCLHKTRLEALPPSWRRRPHRRPHRPGHHPPVPRPPPHPRGRRAERRGPRANAGRGVPRAPRRAHESARRIVISLARSSHVLGPPLERGVYGHSPDDRTLDKQSGSMFDRSCSGTIDTESLVTRLNTPCMPWQNIGDRVPR